jgi:hypothetical protein
VAEPGDPVRLHRRNGDHACSHKPLHRATANSLTIPVVRGVLISAATGIRIAAAAQLFLEPLE